MHTSRVSRVSTDIKRRKSLKARFTVQWRELATFITAQEEHPYFNPPVSNTIIPHPELKRLKKLVNRDYKRSAMHNMHNMHTVMQYRIFTLEKNIPYNSEDLAGP